VRSGVCPAGGALKSKKKYGIMSRPPREIIGYDNDTTLSGAYPEGGPLLMPMAKVFPE
jgi:hypothetical protein